MASIAIPATALNGTAPLPGRTREPLPDRSASAWRNALLGALPMPEIRLLLPFLVETEIRAGETLIEQDRAVESCHFIESGLVALIAFTGDRKPVQVGMLGADGLVGAPAALASEQSPVRAVTQTRCTTSVIPADRLRQLAAECPTLRTLVLGQLRNQFRQSTRSAACIARHSLEQRVARWILDVSDRLGRDSVELTHDFLASLLGVRRASVTCALHVLEGERAIIARRGQLTIRDRTRLAALACAC
ncbi:Crp/Fnr family transcriptional regulator [Propylenella binzhouense]|uniref:Crp/Fnr family transcriptional regulator n=1 Tax=Propylenella binzhouense TaxID=2555902 RepID=A0A964T750_9HYPH|nr:Crp/Fnr family transcriptional regulator [Propylenella binzhouense]MYZ49650.1 Crp/Fnr family transcriptional regulator [Propylenella binzhouense]